MHILLDLRSASNDKSPISVYSKALVDDFLSIPPDEGMAFSILLSPTGPKYKTAHPTVKIFHVPDERAMAFLKQHIRKHTIDVYWSLDSKLHHPSFGKQTLIVRSIDTLEDVVTPHFRGIWRRWHFARWIRPAGLLIVPSQVLATQLRETFPIAQRIPLHIAPPGVSPTFRQHSESELATVRRAYLLPRKYTIMIAREGCNDNLETPLRALAANTEVPAMPCVIVGAGEATPKIKSLIRAYHLEGMVRFIEDTLPSATLSTLLSGAQVVFEPTLREGFIPSILFAFASGTPVICAATQTNETYGKYLLRVHPTSESEWRKAFTSLMLSTMLRDRLIARGLEFATVQTWRPAGQSLLPLFKQQVACL